MSLIYPCPLRTANTLDYLVERQRLARNLAARPRECVPWNHSETIERAQV